MYFKEWNLKYCYFFWRLAMSVCVSVPVLWKSYFRPASGFTHGREIRQGNKTEDLAIYCLSFLEKVRLNKRAGVLLADDGDDAMPSTYTFSGNNATLS